MVMGRYSILQVLLILIFGMTTALASRDADASALNESLQHLEDGVELDEDRGFGVVDNKTSTYQLDEARPYFYSCRLESLVDEPISKINYLTIDELTAEYEELAAFGFPEMSPVEIAAEPSGAYFISGQGEVFNTDIYEMEIEEVIDFQSPAGRYFLMSYFSAILPLNSPELSGWSLFISIEGQEDGLCLNYSSHTVIELLGTWVGNPVDLDSDFAESGAAVKAQPADGLNANGAQSSGPGCSLQSSSKSGLSNVILLIVMFILCLLWPKRLLQ